MSPTDEPQDSTRASPPQPVGCRGVRARGADALLAHARRAGSCWATTSTWPATASGSTARRCSAQTGSIPQWNPYLFGGLPFIAAMHGDIFYPTAWLRWFLPIDTAMNLGFAIHLVLAGFAMYLLLRALRVGWVAALVGGLAYELTGIVASLVKPGHDGKLFVSALAPLAFLALLRAVRDRSPAGYALLAAVVGLGLLSPHYQMTYYLLVAAGLWTLYLVFFAPDRPPAAPLAGRAGTGAGRGGARRGALGGAGAPVPLLHPVLSARRRRRQRRLGVRGQLLACRPRSSSPRSCRSSTACWRATGDATSSSCTRSTSERWSWRWRRWASGTGPGRR